MQTFWGYRLQKSCLLVFWPSCALAACSHVWLYVRMYVRMLVYVCNYLRTYCRIFLCRNLFWILHSLCGTQPIHRHRRRHVSFASVFFFCHSWLLHVLYVSSLSWARVCVCGVCLTVHARTVHAQCTAAVHGLETLQIPRKIAPRHQNKEKTGFRIFLSDFMQFQR